MSELSAELPDPSECFPSKRRKTADDPPLRPSLEEWCSTPSPTLIFFVEWPPEPGFAVGSELERPSSGKSYSENESSLDVRRLSALRDAVENWIERRRSRSRSLDSALANWSERRRSRRLDSRDDLANWIERRRSRSLDREDNHDNHVSSENEDRLLDSKSYDNQLSKPNNTLPMSSTEIGKESNEIIGVEGSQEVRSIARKCPVRHPKAAQLLSVSSSNSDCLNVNLWIEGRHPPPLLLWLRDMFSRPIHYPPAGTIFGNLKPESVLMRNDRLFCGQLTYIKKNNMDPSLGKSTPEAEDLFSRLLKKNPELRLEAREVLLHPFSWSSKFKLHFLRQMSEMLFSENSELDQNLLDELKSNEPPVFNENWNEKLDTVFKDYIRDRPENYNYSSVLELVRCMRNNSVHLPRLPRKIKKKVGWNDEDYYNYFAARFPSVLMKLYGAASQFCRKDRWFKEFHEEIFRELFGRVTLGHW